MRILPRFRIPRFRLRRDKLRRRLRRLSVARVQLILEALTYVSLLVFILTGRRAVFLNEIGHHAEVYASLVVLAVVALFHLFAKHQLVPKIEEYFFPKPYEERRIFAGLGLEARSAGGSEQLYAAIVERIAESLESNLVSLFVREEASGDFLCVASSVASGLERNQQTNLPADGPELKFAPDAFVVKRLEGLSTPLIIESGEFDVWTRVLGTAPPNLRQARILELESLRFFKSYLLVQIRTTDQLVGILSLGMRRGLFGYTSEDKETLVSVAAQLALIIENSRLTQRMVIQERLNRELKLAAEVQRQLLPTRTPE